MYEGWALVHIPLVALQDVRTHKTTFLAGIFVPSVYNGYVLNEIGCSVDMKT
jgi:hypothetical protein